ncbi:hypothetical protein CGRA01v4_01213 [Colletotrichum graminicola]|nr:hypothetical protein CGRA01v4_01213 [Colletotrichum graminicola]
MFLPEAIKGIQLGACTSESRNLQLIIPRAATPYPRSSTYPYNRQNGLRLESRRSHLQPLPRRRLARRAPQLEGGQENHRRAPRRDGAPFCQVGERQAGRAQAPVPGYSRRPCHLLVKQLDFFRPRIRRVKLEREMHPRLSRDRWELGAQGSECADPPPNTRRLLGSELL